MSSGHGDLLEHDAAFAVHLLGIERAPENDVRKQPDGFFDIFIQRFDVETGAFLCGKRVQVGADGVRLRRDVRRAARLRALEEHVLNQM